MQIATDYIYCPQYHVTVAVQQHAASIQTGEMPTYK